MAVTLEAKVFAGGGSAQGRTPWVALLQVAGANAIATYWAVREGWPLLLLMVPFWLQSVLIGWFYRLRILALGRFRTEGFEIDGQPVPETAATRTTTANFLAVHYGIFHAAYAFFLVVLAASGNLGPTGSIDLGDAASVLALGALFGLAQYVEHRRTVAADRALRPNIGAMMFLPYVRIVPMHLMLGVGAMLGGGPSSVVAFGVLKSVADALMLVLEERLVAKSSG